MFRNFSRSKSSNRSSSSSSHSRRGSEHKTDLAITAPKQIVRALNPYKSERPEELSFAQNDFFYVTDDPAGDWFVAFNPLQNTRGLVPISYFEVVQRQDPHAVPVSQARRPQSRGQVNTSGVASIHSRNGSAESQRSYNTSFGTSKNSPHKTLNTHGGGAPYAVRTGSTGSNSSRPRSGARLAIYGFVLYDFQAERNDELTVSAGESIVIVAQSTEEWFVAKPIGRLGGPGLIPVSYVELREVGTDEILLDVSGAIQRAGLPQVDEWKRKLAEYKASSIPLGRFGDSPSSAAAAQTRGHNHNGSYGGLMGVASAGPGGSAGPGPNAASGSTAPGGANVGAGAGSGAGSGSGSVSRNVSGGSTSHGGATAVTTGGPHAPTSTAGVFSPTTPYVLSAKVDKFAINGGRYWYLVKVQMSNYKHRNLCRYYQDFYDFQIKLLEQFPEEAGRTGKQRTLPFMPGPLTLLSHTMTSQRRANLDEYVHELIRMPPYISQSPVVLDLFGVHPGDIERDAPTDEVPQPVDEEANEHYSGDVADGTDSNSESSNTANVTNTPTTTNNSNGSNRDISRSGTDPASHSHTHSRTNPSTTNPPNMNPQSVHTPHAQPSKTPSTQPPAQVSTQQQHQQVLAQEQRNIQAEQMQRLELQDHEQHGRDQQQGSQPRKLSEGSSSQSKYGQFPEGNVSTASVDDIYAQRSGSTDTTATRTQYGDRNASLQKPTSNGYKIKVYAHDEVFAIRMPVESSFSDIFEKIASRLSMPNPQLYTSPEYEGAPVTTAAQFHNALAGGTKLALYLAP